jgi:threonine dehydratase
MTALQPISLTDIREAQERLKGTVSRIPLVRLNFDEPPAEIYLKLENLQPIGSFKLRGAGNVMQLLKKEQLQKGVWTASVGNWAQGVAWWASQLGVKCTIVVPENAAETKIAAIERLGAHVVYVSYDDFWRIYRLRSMEGMKGLFIDDWSEPLVRAGNGTIGLEILEDLPDAEAVVIPYGAGGLFCGMAPGLRALKSDIKIYACEVDTAAPFAASLAAKRPVEITNDYKSSDGIPFLLPGMWELASQFVDDSLVVGSEDVASAIRVLAERNCIIAEVLGARSVAAALTGKAGGGKVVCVISGGNIDRSNLIKIFQGDLP